jgi:tetratricopeptide (TPR) repeat protein
MPQKSVRHAGSACFLTPTGRLTRLPICFILVSLVFGSPARGFKCDALHEYRTAHPAGCGADFTPPSFNETVPSASPHQDRDSADAAKVLAEGKQLAQQNTKEAHLKAIAKYEEALRLFRAGKDRTGQAVTLLAMASSYTILKETRKALESNEQAVPLMEDAIFTSALPAVLYRVGVAYSSMGDQRKALEYLNRALPLVQDEAKRTDRAGILTAIGAAHSHLGERR